MSCVQDLDRDLQDDIAIVSTRTGLLVEDAIARVARRGVRAIPPIETALHTARPAGRLNLVMALRRIGSPESLPLLEHLARWDSDAAVRKEADSTLHDLSPSK